MNSFECDDKYPRLLQGNACYLKKNHYKNMSVARLVR